MATAIQRRRGSTAQHANFTGLSGEITIDTDLNTIIVHDGSTEGGERLAKFSELTEFSGNAITSITTDGNSGLLGGVTEGAANLSINYESLTGNLVPASNNTFSLGSPTNVWKDLYVGAETIFIDGVTLSVSGGSLQFGGNAVAVSGDASVTTDGITEGNTNLYYTDARGRAAISSTGNISFDSNTGIISESLTSDDVDEGNNLYFTTARANSAVEGFDGSISTSGTVAATSFTGNIIGEVLGNVVGNLTGDVTGNVTGQVSDISNHSTSELTEGTNLYFNVDRVRGNISAGGDLGYDAGNGVFSVTTYKSTDFDNDFNAKSTDDLAQGSANLYYSNSLVSEFLVAGTGVTITDGTIAIGQDVGTISEVLFDKVTTTGDAIVGGNLTVQGTQVILNTTTVETTDTIFRVNSGGATGANVGFEANVGGNIKQIVYTTADEWNFGSENVVASSFEGALTGNVTGTVSTLSNHDTADLAEGTNLYYTDTRARASVSATDAGGDGSFSYDSGTGVFTYTGPSASEVRAHFSGGTGVTITDGAIAIGQAVGTGDNVTFNNVTAAGVFAGNGSALTTLNASNISSGTLASSRLPELVVGDFADAAIQTGAEAFADSDTVLMTAAAVDNLIVSKGFSTTTGTVTSVGSGNGLTGGPITGSGSLAVGAGAFIIVNAANVAVDATSANTASKVVARDADGSFAANVITATATQARYADVAERYEADSVIEPGTVVCFGGEKEITVCAHQAHHAVAGVISTDPAYLMNEAAGNNDTHPPVALTGRVPCKVTGAVNKGDLMVSSAVAGHAKADNDAAPGRILGKAIGSSEGGEAVIEVLVTLM